MNNKLLGKQIMECKLLDQKAVVQFLEINCVFKKIHQSQKLQEHLMKVKFSL